jgi:hypothetical protein
MRRVEGNRVIRLAVFQAARDFRGQVVAAADHAGCALDRQPVAAAGGVSCPGKTALGSQQRENTTRAVAFLSAIAPSAAKL